jgi:hypothetical protein
MSIPPTVGSNDRRRLHPLLADWLDVEPVSRRRGREVLVVQGAADAAWCARLGAVTHVQRSHDVAQGARYDLVVVIDDRADVSELARLATAVRAGGRLLLIRHIGASVGQAMPDLRTLTDRGLRVGTWEELSDEATAGAGQPGRWLRAEYHRPYQDQSDTPRAVMIDQPVPGPNVGRECSNPQAAHEEDS